MAIVANAGKNRVNDFVPFNNLFLEQHRPQMSPNIQQNISASDGKVYVKLPIGTICRCHVNKNKTAKLDWSF